MNVKDLIVETVGHSDCKVIHPQTGMFEVVTGPHFHKNKKKAVKRLSIRLKKEQKVEESQKRRSKPKGHRKETLKRYEPKRRKNFSEND